MKEQEGNITGMMHSALLMLVLLVMSLSSFAQTYPFREYTSDDGLPQLETMGAMQDSRGYIWMNTRNGLAQFDGHSFIPYYRKDGLPSNIVNRIIEDEDGTIWAVTTNGLARFTGRTFHSYPVPDSMKIKQVGFTCLSGKPGTFFLVGRSTDKIRIIVFDSGRYYDYSKMNPVLQKDSLAVAAFDKNDSALYLKGPDAALYNFRNGILTVIDKNHLTPAQIKDDIISISGRKYFSDNEPDGLYFSGEYSEAHLSGIVNKFGDNPDSIMNKLHPGSDGIKWKYGNVVFSITDRDSTLWIMTDTKIFRMVSDAFTQYEEDDGLVQNPWALAADPAGGLWIGSISRELQYFDGERFINKNVPDDLFHSKPAYFRGSTTLSNGEVWISTNQGVLIRDGKRFRRLDKITEDRQVCIIYEDPVDKTIFIGTDRGLYHIDGEKVTLYPEMTGFDLGVVEGMTRDFHGNYWLAGHYGIVLFDGKTFTPFRSDPAPAEMVWGIIHDYKGNIWSAGSDGIFFNNPDNPGFIPALPEESNLPANVIRDIGDHRLLIGRMLDLCIIDLDKYYNGERDYYSILGRNMGYNGNDCQDNGITQDANGKWWLLTNDKLICFDANKLNKNKIPPLVHITKVEVPSDTADWVTVLDTALFYNPVNNVAIRGRRNFLKISFTCVSTRYPEEITYQYRVSGLGENWSVKIHDRSVILNDLPPGKYTFELNAYNSDGVSSTVPATLNISVTPKFFQRLGIKIALVVIAVALIAFLSFQIRRRVNRKRVDSARLQAEGYKMQLSSVISQLDPHFTFNAVSSIGSLIMKGEKEKAYSYLLKLTGLLRSVLTDSPVLLKPITEEVEFVTRFLELQKLRYGKRFDYSLKVAENVDQNTLVPKMVLQSIVDNAVKHGIENKKGTGVIEIEVNKVPNGHEFVVRDNGIGRKAAAELNSYGAGLGLKNIISSMEMMNKANSVKAALIITDLYDNGIPSGTEVRGFLPANYTFDVAINTKQHRNKLNRL
ncbi:MAG: histidine kinase [Bacteroidales bacterium]